MLTSRKILNLQTYFLPSCWFITVQFDNHIKVAIHAGKNTCFTAHFLLLFYFYINFVLNVRKLSGCCSKHYWIDDWILNKHKEHSDDIIIFFNLHKIHHILFRLQMTSFQIPLCTSWQLLKQFGVSYGTNELDRIVWRACMFLSVIQASILNLHSLPLKLH